MSGLRTREQLNADNVRLRASVSGDSQFMTGHGIKKARTAFHRNIPEWTQSDEQVRQFLLSTFPVLRMSNESSWGVMKLRIALMPRRQRERAERQLDKAVYLYSVLTMIYRIRLTESEAAFEIRAVFVKRDRKKERDAVRDALKIIRRHRPV
jgi:hypothetical protein